MGHFGGSGAVQGGVADAAWQVPGLEEGDLEEEDLLVLTEVLGFVSWV